MEEVVKSVTEKNFIFIEEFNLLNLTPRITLTLKKLNENDDAVLDKKYLLSQNQMGIQNKMDITEICSQVSILNMTVLFYIVI